jgi:hypothetical protein
MATTMGQKLQIKPGVPISVVNAPEDVKSRLPMDLPDNLLSFGTAKYPSALMIFVKNKAEVEQFVFPLLANGKEFSPVWLLYPKGTSGVPTDIGRDILWKLVEPKGWGPARIIALDEVWSALRFTPKKTKIFNWMLIYVWLITIQ